MALVVTFKLSSLHSEQFQFLLNFFDQRKDQSKRLRHFYLGTFPEFKSNLYKTKIWFPGSINLIVITPGPVKVTFFKLLLSSFIWYIKPLNVSLRLSVVGFYNSASVFPINSQNLHLNFSHVCRWSSKLIRFQIYFCKFHIQNHLNSISPHLHPLLDRFLLQNEIQHVYISQVSSMRFHVCLYIFTII